MISYNQRWIIWALQETLLLKSTAIGFSQVFVTHCLLDLQLSSYHLHLECTESLPSISWSYPLSQCLEGSEYLCLNPFNVTNAGTRTPLSGFKSHVGSVHGGDGVDCSQCTEQGARVIGLWRHMRAIHSLGTLPPESSNYQAAAGRSVLGIHIQPVEVNL